MCSLGSLTGRQSEEGENPDCKHARVILKKKKIKGREVHVPLDFTVSHR